MAKNWNIKFIIIKVKDLTIKKIRMEDAFIVYRNFSNTVSVYEVNFISNFELNFWNKNFVLAISGMAIFCFNKILFIL